MIDTTLTPYLPAHLPAQAGAGRSDPDRILVYLV